MSKITKVVKTVRTTEVVSGDDSHLKLHAFWALKVLFQGLLMGLICGVFLYYFGMVSVLGSCYECVDILTLITEPFIKLVDFLLKLLPATSFDINQVTFYSLSGAMIRIGINAVCIFIIFSAIFLRFGFNVKTVHLLVLSTLSLVFFAMSLFTLALISGGAENSLIAYIVGFAGVCVIFTYAASVKFRGETESSGKEVFTTVLSILFVAGLAMLPLLKIS